MLYKLVGYVICIIIGTVLGIWVAKLTIKLLY
jgi:ABC-type proline/glycine betaine transport system permease subunit